MSQVPTAHVEQRRSRDRRPADLPASSGSKELEQRVSHEARDSTASDGGLIWLILSGQHADPARGLKGTGAEKLRVRNLFSAATGIDYKAVQVESTWRHPSR